MSGEDLWRVVETTPVEVLQPMPYETALKVRDLLRESFPGRAFSLAHASYPITALARRPDLGPDQGA